jgi:hypothetical protein
MFLNVNLIKHVNLYFSEQKSTKILRFSIGFVLFLTNEILVFCHSKWYPKLKITRSINSNFIHFMNQGSIPASNHLIKV